MGYIEATPVSTRAELEAIASNPTGVYGLAADIDLGDSAWSPICNGSSPFTGTLYGNGHVLSNLVVTGNSSYSGFFGCIAGTVSDVKLVNPVVSGYDHIGAFAGCVKGGANVSRCAVIGGTVTAIGNYSGVFAGSVEGASTVSECFSVGSIVSSAGYVGGFSGYVGQNNTAVRDCYTVADAKGTSNVGSFTGYAESSSASITR